MMRRAIFWMARRKKLNGWNVYLYLVIETTVGQIATAR